MKNVAQIIRSGTKPIVFFLLSMIGQLISAQETVMLWDKEAKPYYKENTLREYEKEEWGTLNAYDVTEPTLTIYPAKGKKSKKSVLILPGGGYSLVAVHHEGYDLAEVLAARGITAAVLKYRLPNSLSSNEPHKVPLADTRQALKILKSKADIYEFDPTAVGVLGFSAGSHLATVASLWKSGDPNENPAFSALIYGITSLRPKMKAMFESNLFHREMTKEDITQYSLVNLVTTQTPPAFLVHSYDDPICQVTESTLYAEKLAENKVPVEIHLFSKGGHGYGMGRKEDGTDQWVPLFINWLKNL